MTTIPHSQRYLPHDLLTKFYACKLYRSGHSVRFVCRRYKISKASLMRWNKKFDGNKDSLRNKPHTPLSPHPNAHTPLEMKSIRDYMRRNPHISLPELYGKLRIHKAYRRHPASLYRFMRKLGYFKPATKKSTKYIPKPYDTPSRIGVKWQLDVKFVPTACYTGTIPQKFYQYTVIDEASRERFIFPYLEQSSYSTVDFMKRAFTYFGYQPSIVQTDNGSEFTHIKKTDRVHPLDMFLQPLGITHQLIRPRTPRHNGKVERSHRNDQERFYNYLHFYSYEDLKKQMKAYLKRSNQTPMSVLQWKSPIQQRQLLQSVI